MLLLLLLHSYITYGCGSINGVCMHWQWYFYRFVIPYASFWLISLWLVLFSLSLSLFSCGHSRTLHFFLFHSIPFSLISLALILSVYLLLSIRWALLNCNCDIWGVIYAIWNAASKSYGFYCSVCLCVGCTVYVWLKRSFSTAFNALKALGLSIRFLF